MQNRDPERELLLGILALQNNFVSQEQLLTGFREWTGNKSVSLADILERQRALKKNTRPALEALVDAHIANHDNSAEQSLSSVKSLPPDLSEQIQQIDDADLQNSISGALGLNDGIALTVSMGAVTSDCGRFRILRPHRRGGLGEVFVAQDEELDREVALKQILNQQINEEQRLRFVREAEITGKLEHPGVVPVYGLGQDSDGRPYYAMRFVRGQSLRDGLEEFHERDCQSNRDPAERNKEFRRMLGWFIDVCHAIGYAHSRGVLHRDLKPSNVMLGRFGETLVVDWGLARVVGVDDALTPESDERPVLANLSGTSSETVDGTAVGTPAYMSPEQAEGRLDLLNPATDVYCLGATLWSILTGKPPLTGKTVDVIERVLKGAIPPAREVNATAPPSLEAVCRKAMSLKREDRYQSARELAAEVEAWLADEPVSACPEPARDKLRRWTRRHQTAVTTVAAAVLIVAASASLAATLLGEKNQKLEDANIAIRDKNIELEDSNRATEEARQRASSVKDYLVSAFRSADPAQDGKSLTVAEVLRRSLNEMGEQLADDDPTRAELLAAIGESYRGLGLYRESLEVFQKEHDLRVQVDGSQTEPTLRAAYNVALATYYAGDYSRAISLHEANIETQKSLLGEAHNDTLNSMNGLAMALSSDGQLPESMKIYEKILEQRKARERADSPAMLMTINNLASSYQDNGKLKEAYALFQKQP